MGSQFHATIALSTWDSILWDNTRLVFGMCWVRTSTETPDTHTEGFHGFPLTSEATADLVTRLDKKTNSVAFSLQANYTD
jgi:hypothetical protein